MPGRTSDRRSRVLTKDHGFQEIRWIGSRKVLAAGKFAPVVFMPGAIGNTKTMRLSQQHRVRIAGALPELYFGHTSVLAPAHSLVNGHDIFVQQGGEIEYFHILFDQHEMVISDGTWTESFYPAARTVSQQDAASKAEIFELFPELEDHPGAYGSTARHCLKAWEGKLLSAVATTRGNRIDEPARARKRPLERA